ncbi:hypothetical protein SM033_00149 [Vibrio phage vB_VpaM_sm033]|nr:hypothetical protein SM033_00149 [Vibrio phage vB_VpaM_sm033]
MKKYLTLGGKLFKFFNAFYPYRLSLALTIFFTGLFGVMTAMVGEYTFGEPQVQNSEYVFTLEQCEKLIEEQVHVVRLEEQQAQKYAHDKEIEAKQLSDELESAQKFIIEQQEIIAEQKRQIDLLIKEIEKTKSSNDDFWTQLGR